MLSIHRMLFLTLKKVRIVKITNNPVNPCPLSKVSNSPPLTANWKTLQPTMFLSKPVSTLASDVCYFGGNGDGKLHEVTSFCLDTRLRGSAYILTESGQTLIGKLS